MTLGGFAAALAIAHSLPRYMVRWVMRKIWGQQQRGEFDRMTAHGRTRAEEMMGELKLFCCLLKAR